MTKILDCDVVVVGGGPAGAVAASVLAGDGISAVLLESSQYKEARIGETLPPRARSLLTRLGVWQQFLGTQPIQSFGNQSVWGGPDLESASFIFNPYGCGWHVDRQRFDRMLATTAQEHGVLLFTGAHVSACNTRPPTEWRVAALVETKLWEIRAKVVIDATGRRAALAKSLGARRVLFDHLVGIAAAYEAQKEMGSYTLVETTPSGWWYSTAVPPDRTVVMFMTDADLCRAGGFNQAHVFEQALAETAHSIARVKGRKRMWGPKVFSAVSHVLERTRSSSPWVAAGDAAMAVDPLSSSGILRALETGEAAAIAIHRHLAGDRTSIATYEQLLYEEYRSYATERTDYYSLEQRWPESPFWQRRHASG